MTNPSGSTTPENQKRSWYRKLLTFWTLIVVVSAVAIGVFADVGEDVANHETTALDNAVRLWLIAHRNPLVYKIAYAITWAGSPPVMIALALVAGALFYHRRGRSKAGIVIAAPAVGGLFSAGTKLLFARTRPSGAALLSETTYSFPSGHAATSAAVVVTLCYILARERIISWPAAIIVGALVPLLVGWSRLYLDVHWTTDVVGGWMVGLFVAAACAGIYEYLRRSAPPAVARSDALPAE
ncbi:MAG: phosphatase PAP2 family protein [Gemmatimonadales bacterium]